MLKRRLTVHKSRHTPPPGLAFGEPDDGLQRSIQYAAAFRQITDTLEYWITRFRG